MRADEPLVDVLRAAAVGLVDGDVEGGRVGEGQGAVDAHPASVTNSIA